MAESIKILGINASPRKYGNTYKLLEVALYTARKLGAEVELVHLYDYDIKPCIGCLSDEQLACRYPCVIEDDGRIILEKILRSDGLIIATPLYWYGPSGHLKNLLDRMTVFENMIFVEGRSWVEGKVAGFIAVGNDSGNVMAIAYMMIVLNSMGFIIPPWALAYYIGGGDVFANKSSILDAANVGKVVVDTLKMIKKDHKWYDSKIFDKLKEDIVSIVQSKALEEYSKQIEARRKIILKLMNKYLRNRGSSSDRPHTSNK